MKDNTMKKNTIALLIYLFGCVWSYSLFKKEVIKTTKVWTKKDRAFGLMICSGSYITVVAMVVVSSPAEPADW